jgi:folate-binding protein YgfZ
MSDLSVGFARLGQGAFLRITGEDATRWLNGMVTNSIQALEPGQGNYNFLLNAQGRIQGDCNIYREPGGGAAVFVLETTVEQLDAIEAMLDRFIIMDDVVLERGINGLENAHGIVLLGTNAAEELKRLVGVTPTAAGQMTVAGDVVVLAPPVSGVPCFEVWANELRVPEGVRELSAEELETLRVEAGSPKFGVDIRDKDLPQETNQTQALHFNKGCYLGQEIVERIRSRGQVHRQFFKLALEGAVPAELPAVIEAEGKAVGEITSVATVDGKLLGLGYVRREAVELKRALTYAGGSVAVRT